VKQWLIRRALGVRQSMPALFARGSYYAIDVTGPAAAHVVAFMRSLGDTHCLVVAPRLPGRLLAGDDSIVMPTKVWHGTELQLPAALIGHKLRNTFVDTRVAPHHGSLPLAEVFATFPAALFVAV
jgi:(1->4)-alpha-D-glucan 1-alpha-D-glucosylmutase